MKHFFLLLCSVCLLAACSDDDNTYVYRAVSDGLFVLNTGQAAGGIDGSITYYDYKTQTATQNWDRAGSGQSLGGTPNDIIGAGEYMFVAGTDEKKVFVINPRTGQSVAIIDCLGKQPRRMARTDSHVFVSTYQNKVLAINATTLAIDRQYDCGSYAEGVAVSGNYLYVANSNWGYGNASITKIDLANGATSEIKNEFTRNVHDIYAIGDRIYFLDYGTYDASWNQTGQGVYRLNADGTAQFIVAATDMTVLGSTVYTFNAPYATPMPPVDYNKFSVADERVEPFIVGSEVEHPAKLSADVVKGYILVSSYHQTDGHPDSAIPGYCAIYTYGGQYVTQFPCGVGTYTVLPNAYTYYEPQQ